MAFDSRGWRRLIVGTELFNWQETEGRNSVERFRVRPDREPRRLLRVVYCSCGSVSGWGWGTLPGDVRKAIDAAAEHGWPGARVELRLYSATSPTCPYVGAKSNWRSPTVLTMAQSIWDEQAFDRMPILADALEEAGCDHPDVLSHCRGPGPHVRGCWVVDLLLGKS